MKFDALPKSQRGVRASLVGMTVLVSFLNGILDRWNLGMTQEVLMALIALVGAAVVGDTVRPSGMAKNAPPSAAARSRVTRAPMGPGDEPDTEEEEGPLAPPPAPPAPARLRVPLGRRARHEEDPNG